MLLESSWLPLIFHRHFANPSVIFTGDKMREIWPQVCLWGAHMGNLKQTCKAPLTAHIATPVKIIFQKFRGRPRFIKRFSQTSPHPPLIFTGRVGWGVQDLASVFRPSSPLSCCRFDTAMYRKSTTYIGAGWLAHVPYKFSAVRSTLKTSGRSSLKNVGREFVESLITQSIIGW